MARNSDIATRVAELGDLPREDLVDLWRKNFNTAPPKGVHRDLLTRAAAHHIQIKEHGGLSREARRVLRLAIRDAAKGLAAKKAAIEAKAAAGSLVADLADVVDTTGDQPSAPQPSSRLHRAVLPGARLIREWGGHTIVVDVVDGGFIYLGRRYRSLSKIAREITGTNWSGPRFFGL